MVSRRLQRTLRAGSEKALQVRASLASAPLFPLSSALRYESSREEDELRNSQTFSTISWHIIARYVDVA